MTRLRESDLRGVLEFLREADTVTGGDPFPPSLVGALRALVPCYGVGFCELDQLHERLLAESCNCEDVECFYTAPEDVPEGREDERFWSLVLENPVTAYQRATRDFRAIKLSDFVTVGEWHRTQFYNELLLDGTCEYQMKVGIPSPLWHTKNFMLQNGRDRRDFDERDRLVLNLLQPHLAARYRDAAVRRRAAAAVAALEAAAEEANEQGVVLLRPDGRIEFASVRARRMVADYFPGAAEGDLPLALADWVRRQETRVNGDGLPPPASPFTVFGRGGRLNAFWVRPAEPGALATVLLREEATARDVPNLTMRETEVLTLVAEGKTNAEVARALWVSPHTVRKHLENIYKRLGVATRTAAVARVFGTSLAPGS